MKSLLAPIRFEKYFGHNDVNIHLTNGGSIENIPRYNPYYDYYQELIKKHGEERQARSQEGDSSMLLMSEEDNGEELVL
jgi:hypothetical protein